MKKSQKPIKIIILSIVLIICTNSFAQNKSDKIKVYKAWVKLLDGSKAKGVLYAADSSGVKLSDGITSDNLNTLSAEKIKEIRIRKKGRVGKGVWIGALSGATFGAIMGIASGDDEAGWFSFSKEEKAAMNAIGLGTLGAGIGALVATGKKKIIINGDLNNYKIQLGLIQSYSLNPNINN